ncbi:9033_t:CDS:1, partial [Paraglomus occultum]
KPPSQYWRDLSSSGGIASSSATPVVLEAVGCKCRLPSHHPHAALSPVS